MGKIKGKWKIRIQNWGKNGALGWEAIENCPRTKQQ